MSAPPPCTADTASPASPTPEFKPKEFSNAFLLKMDTHDKYATSATIKKQIAKANGGQELVGLVRAGKNPSKPAVFLAFDTEENQKAAELFLTTQMKWRSKLWVSLPVTEQDFSVTHKKVGKREREQAAVKQAEDAGQREPNVCQWRNVEYASQRSRKHVHCQRILKTISKYAADKSIALRSGMLVETVVPSPTLHGYRNNCQLSVGFRKDGVTPVCGFTEGSSVAGSCAVMPCEAHVVPTVHYAAQRVSEVFMSAVVAATSAAMPHPCPPVAASSSNVTDEDAAAAAAPAAVAEPIPWVYDRRRQVGFWRKVHVRHNARGELMIDISYRGVEATPEALALAKANIVAAFNEKWAELIPEIETNDQVLAAAASAKTENADLLRAVTDADFEFFPCPADVAAAEAQRASEAAKAAAEATAAAAAAAATSTTENDSADKKKGDDSAAVGGDVNPATPFAAQRWIKSKIVSVQWHRYDGTSAAPADTPREVLFGKSTLEETLLGLRFDLSPSAFFQVNRLGTEALLRKAAAAANLTKDTILLDLCCGTGTIGLCLADQVKEVIGVEMVADAVENAKANAVRNKVTNASHVCGKVEDVVRGILDKLPAGADVVAILDPPRCGVHKTVVKWLRNCSAVRRLVYISCEQRALETDCEGLTKPATNEFYAPPFDVVASYGVDLFPHTPHVEMVVVMQRQQPPAPRAPAVPSIAAATAAAPAA